MKAKYLQPQVRTGSDTVLHLKTYEPLTSGTDTLFDYSLRGHTGTLKGTAALKFPGCDFDGDSDYIEVADHADFSFVLTPFSVSVWCYMHDATSFGMVSKGVLNTDGEWGLGTLSAPTADKIGFFCYDESVNNCYIGRSYDTALTSYENQWVHVVAVYDSGTTSAAIKIYLNGTRIDDTDSEFNPSSFEGIENLTGAVWIGRHGTGYANGLIDDVIIYKKELSAADVISIYNTTKWRYGT